MTRPPALSVSARSPGRVAAIEFRGKIVGMGPGASWAFVYLPKSASQKLGAKGRVPIRGTINGFRFRSSAFPTGDGTHEFAVNKAMQAGAKAKPGDTVDVRIEVDTATRMVRVPNELKRALAKSPKAQANFKALAWSHRKAYVDWIAEAKKPETKARRIDRAIERLSEGKGYFY